MHVAHHRSRPRPLANLVVDHLGHLGSHLLLHRWRKPFVIRLQGVGVRTGNEGKLHRAHLAWDGDVGVEDSGLVEETKRPFQLCKLPPKLSRSRVPFQIWLHHQQADDASAPSPCVISTGEDLASPRRWAPGSRAHFAHAFHPEPRPPCPTLLLI